jgi:CheY-like chemotaxis protein
MIKFEAGELFSAVESLRADNFTGTVYLEIEKTSKTAQGSFVLTFHKGMMTFVGKMLPTAETLAALIKKKLNLTHIDSALKAASERVKNKKSIREPLEFISRFGLFKWEDLEVLMQSQAVYFLEQVLPYAGVFKTESSTNFDLSYGDDYQGFQWEKLQQELAQRKRMWAALAPSIPSMDAVPLKTASDRSEMPESMLRHLNQCVDGQRSLADIANSIDRDPLQLAQHYLPWVKKGCIAFKPIPGAPSQPTPQTEAVPSTGSSDLPIILSVDDSPIVQTMIKRSIGDRYQVLLANNAVNALNLLNTHKVALLLLDVTMPDIDGLELCRTIRGISKFRDLPVVMLTAKDGLFDKMKSQFAGSTHYLTKPVDRDKLLPVIDRYVGQGHPVSFVKS